MARFALSRRTFIAGAGALTALHPFSLRAAAGEAHLRLMATSDLHVHVYPWDYYADRPLETVGLARTAAIVGEIRAEAANSVLFDNGDFLQGNPMGDYVAYERGMREGDMHPVIAAMNALGFEAATLGNHEFNYGLDFLMKSLAGAAFPITCANVVSGALGAAPRADATLVKPYAILDRSVTDGAGVAQPIRIGVIGVTPPQIMMWDRKHLEGSVNVRDIVEAVAAWAPEMREAGADVVVALCHSGIGAAEGAWLENAAVPLSRLAGIDAIILGHQHRVFPGKDYEGAAGADAAAGKLGAAPAVMPGFWGSHLGLVDLLLSREGGAWRVLATSSETRPIYMRDESRKVRPLVESAPAILESVKADHEATLAYVRRPVGKTAGPLHSYFALVADDPSVQIVSAAQVWYIRQMLKGTEWEGLPLLSAAAPFKSGGRGGPDYYTDVPAGDVAIRNVADLYLYPNTARAVLITGAELKDWLERSAGIFNRLEPGGADQPLIDAAFPSYNFDVMDGVTYAIDITQPSKFDPDGTPIAPDASRIADLRYQGAPVDPAAKFVVATNNYRASGGGHFPGASGETIIFEGPDTNRDVLVRYIVEQGVVDPKADANWRFAPAGGATAIFETGPKSAAYVGSVPLSMEEAGLTPEGFLRWRIRL